MPDVDVLGVGDGTGGQHHPDPLLCLIAVALLEGFGSGVLLLAVLLECHFAAGQLPAQGIHLFGGGAVEHGSGQVHGQVGTGHLQQLHPGGAVGTGLVDGLLLGTDGLFHGLEGVIALCLGKGLVQLRGGLFGHGVQVDLELCGLAGQLFDPEIRRIGEVEPEHLTSRVTVDGVLSIGHQLAVAQHHHDVLHPAVGDLLAVHVAGKVQQDPVAGLGGGIGVVVDGVGAGRVDKLLLEGLLGHRADMAGNGQTLVLTEGRFGKVVLLGFHNRILLLSILSLFGKEIVLL